MTGMDHEHSEQAVPGYNIDNTGDVAENIADEGPHGIGYCQAGDGEIVAAAEYTAARAGSVALDCQTNTQVPGADSRFEKTSVPRPVENTHATMRKHGYGILVVAV